MNTFSTTPSPDGNRFLFPREKPSFSDSPKEIIDDFLEWASELGVSDIKIQSNNEIFIRTNGMMKRSTRRKLIPNEVADLLNAIYPNGPTIVQGGKPVDSAFELRPYSKSDTNQKNRYRFRVNAVGGQAKGQKAIEITIRTIEIEPPTMDKIKLDQQIIDGLFPEDGIVLLVGETGSGKTTTLASIIRWILEQEDSNKIIVTLEAPIEYVFDSINKPSCTIFQSEIGEQGDMKTFDEGVRSSMRRALDIALIGEIRDAPTTEAAIAVSESGHTIYSSMHANSVTDTFQRFSSFFPPAQRSSALVRLVNTMRSIVWQRLFLCPNGKERVALREHLHFTDAIRRELLDIGAENELAMLNRLRVLVQEKGKSAPAHAAELFKQGLLSESDMRKIVAHSKYA